MYVPHAWLYRGLRSEGSSRTWTELSTFEQKVLTFKTNNALNLCTYPWPVSMFVTKFGSGLGAFSVTAKFVTSSFWQCFVINFIFY